MRYLNVANLETALWIARLGSFTAAAERLHTTQPAISTRIRELESALGIKLFSRSARGVEPTLEGRAFLDKVQPLLQHLQELSASVKTGGGVRGTVRIGAGNICMDWFPSMVIALRQALPHVTYDVELGLGSRMLQRLETRKLDIAIISGPVDGAKFDAQSLGYDRMVWMTAPHLLDEAGGDMPTFLREMPLWCVQRDSYYWQAAVRALGGDEVVGHLNAIDNMAAAAHMVLRGGGAALLSETLVRADLAAGRIVPLPGIPPGEPVEFSVAWSKGDRHPVLAQVVEAATRASTFARTAAPA
ncbi:LysR family transcriptional regulator [Ramlibacter sp.]|uniref:LysR family transcriptional regulator n=1 Tax=Ramlibacter sp. TaxID=1917967 RepID=UPI003D12FF1A